MEPIWRDEDVLDTWFSSALWPFSTLGWPDETPELSRYYPTSVLVTGFDIIFFWVARMMMMGMHFMKDVPFRDVYIHALVRDEKGAKMSKSKGNVVDPLSVMDEYGADALRFTMAAMAAQGRDIKLSLQRIEGYRNFATKLWNAARFCEMNGCVRQPGFDPAKAKTTLNKWLYAETSAAVAAVTEALEAYRFNDAAAEVYRFVWNRFCDWYVEFAKPVFMGEDEAAKAETQAMAAWALDEILKLLHPFMPFITEELWAVLGEEGPKRETLLCLAEWPKAAKKTDAKAVDEVNWVIGVISEIRSLRSEMNVPPASTLPLTIAGADKETKARAKRYESFLKRMARLSGIVDRRYAAARLGAVRAGRGNDGAGACECDRPRRRARAARQGDRQAGAGNPEDRRALRQRAVHGEGPGRGGRGEPRAPRRRGGRGGQAEGGAEAAGGGRGLGRGGIPKGKR